MQKEYWFYVKFFFLIIGILGAFAALQTGDMAEDNYEGGSLENVIETHKAFAISTTYIFGALALAYLIALAEKQPLLKNNAIFGYITKLKNILLNR